MNSEAYNKGYNAFHLDETNPYEEGTECHRLFEVGLGDAAIEVYTIDDIVGDWYYE